MCGNHHSPFFLCPLLQSSPGHCCCFFPAHYTYSTRKTPPPPLLSHLAYFPQRCLTTSTVLSRSSFLRGTRCPRPANTWCFSAGLQRTRVLNVTTRRRGMTSDRAGAQDQEVGRLQSVNIVLITKPKTTGKLKAFFFISVSGMSFSFLFLRNFT